VARWFWKLLLKLFGWDTRVRFPEGVRKCVVIIAPHTSWIDLFVGIAYRSVIRLHPSRFLGKKELFKGPVGWFLRTMGGIPVDRSSATNVVDQVVAILDQHDELMIAIAPEGTRERVDRLRSGFYQIAKKAGIPIIMAGLDFKKRTLVVSAPFHTTADPAADFRHILAFFRPIQGRHPEKGLGHLFEQPA
jgi:1-acyl-sn-glycerol-3-phosphate acyltransferase